ncbi:ABC transporter substrate-binding protein [Paenibacillus whitsoniae]|uniref:Sugar ABC transporter substrate-binding protein n=1 Tax=Paenibacillus whitsoniae TaxID=2496558 RepID=A0A430J6F3_9BACL|nr:sugar ABC transporter substrate-binding protein [Paenibacillus whitsoniae]RTE04308.1 sugar ABC transporter substrate-binding protein [Paenibacillus whitsoniae]
MEQHKSWLTGASVMLLLSAFLSACSGSGNQDKPSSSPAASNVSAGNADKVTLKYWTWSPSAEVYKPVIEKFEASHPNIKVELSIVGGNSSSPYQTKMPLALTTGEDLDIVGVQTGGMPKQIESYLLPLDDLMKSTIGADWQSKFTPNSIKQLQSQTSSGIKFLSMGSVGSMVMYYNKDILDQLGVSAPKTYDDLKNIAKSIKDKKLDILPVAVNAKDGWTLDEIVWTIAGQQSSIYNKFHYNSGGKLDSPEYTQALASFKKLFDDGIFSKKDIFDLDYDRSKTLFTTGKAALFIQGTWEANMISEKVRQDNKININDVGIAPIPSIEPNGKPSIRSFIDMGLGIVKTSKHPKEAAQLIQYLTTGEGNDALNNQFLFTSNKVDAKIDQSLLTSPTAKESYQTLVSLVANSTADRNNNSKFSDVTGNEIQRYILNGIDPATEAKALQKEFDTGKYPN